jgi:Peptidoglycan-binding protein, CsiV
MKTKALNMPAVLTFVISLLMTNFSSAQNTQAEKAAPNHQGWYQVEMIIFSRNNPSLQEHFPSNIHLGYPSHWQVLKDPNPVANNLTAESELPVSSTDLTLDTNNTNTPISVDLNTQPFYHLRTEFRQLNSAADKMARSADYTVLFHQAWRQPITSQSQADWILINNSRINDQEPLLSGSIRLSVATYLRLDTRLWFAEFEPRLDDTPSIWPEIPESPDQIIQEIDASKSEFFSNEAPENISGEELPNTEQWQTKRIVLLKDKREMRSNEMNYIDHPILGIIIKISPFTPSTLNSEPENPEE